MAIGPQKIHIGRALTINFGVHYPFKTDFFLNDIFMDVRFNSGKARAVIWQI